MPQKLNWKLSPFGDYHNGLYTIRALRGIDRWECRHNGLLIKLNPCGLEAAKQFCELHASEHPDA